MKRSFEDDPRLDQVRRLGEQQRSLERDLLRVREELASLVTVLLPPHAPEKQIAEIVAASGSSRTFVESLRGGQRPGA